MEIEWASLGRAVLFLGIPFVLIIFYLQWQWAQTCSKYIRVLVALKGGGGKWEFAPKEGGKVSIYNPDTKETRTWPINELATIEVPYPGVGFVPLALQKTIRLAIVNEGDWEPMLNRSPHRMKIASPDVVKYLQSLAEKAPSLRIEIDDFLAGVSTGPTREMVADPAALGNLERSGVLKALANVGDELLEAMKGLRNQLVRLAGLNPTWVYILLGMTLVLSAVNIYFLAQVFPNIEQTIVKLDSIRSALGIK